MDIRSSLNVLAGLKQDVKMKLIARTKQEILIILYTCCQENIFQSIIQFKNFNKLIIWFDITLFEWRAAVTVRQPSRMKTWLKRKKTRFFYLDPLQTCSPSHTFYVNGNWFRSNVLKWQVIHPVVEFRFMSNNHQVDLPVVDDIGYQHVAGYSAAVGF